MQVENVKTEMEVSRIFVSNWKAHDRKEDIEEFISGILHRSEFSSQTCFLALPFEYLKELSQKYNDPHLVFGASYMNSVDKGSFTEPIAVKMLKEAGASFVLIGSHLYRRAFSETNEAVNMKIKRALNEGLKPVLCVGETSQDAFSGRTKKVLSEMLNEGLQGLMPDQLSQIIIIFEAPWINTAKFVPPLKSLSTAYTIYKEILNQFLGEQAANMQVIYAFPPDLKDLDGLLGTVEAGGFYTSNQEFFYHLLDIHAHTDLQELVHRPKEKSPQLGSAESTQQTIITAKPPTSAIPKPLELKKTITQVKQATPVPAGEAAQSVAGTEEKDAAVVDVVSGAVSQVKSEERKVADEIATTEGTPASAKAAVGIAAPVQEEEAAGESVGVLDEEMDDLSGIENTEEGILAGVIEEELPDGRIKRTHGVADITKDAGIESM